jgi:hypothetical protein
VWGNHLTCTAGILDIMPPDITVGNNFERKQLFGHEGNNGEQTISWVLDSGLFIQRLYNVYQTVTFNLSIKGWRKVKGTAVQYSRFPQDIKGGDNE